MLAHMLNAFMAIGVTSGLCRNIEGLEGDRRRSVSGNCGSLCCEFGV